MDFLKTLMPNPAQAASLFRSGLQIAGTWLAARGFDTGGQTWEIVSGMLLAAAVTGYGSIYKRTDTNLVASAASVPGVIAIEAVQAIANAIPSPKVR